MHHDQITSGNATDVTDVLLSVGRNSSQTGQLALAATEVVLCRMTLGGLAMVNPVVDGHDEFSRMIPEKTRAFADASSILISQSAQIGQAMTRIVVDGVELAADATTVVLASRSPGVILAAQADVALAWVRQITARSGAMCLLVLEAQGAVMAPIHQAARDNVERLRRWRHQARGDGREVT